MSTRKLLLAGIALAIVAILAFGVARIRENGNTQQAGVPTATIISANVQATAAPSATLPPATATRAPAITNTPAPTATPTILTLAGLVRDAETGKPVSQAHFSAGERQAQSDAEGRYELRGLALNIEVSVRAAGYEEQKVVWKGENPLSVALQPERVKLLVSDQGSAAPLAGAEIRRADAVAKTDEKGLAQLARLMSGDALEISLEGYLPEKLTYQGEKEIKVSLAPRILRGVVRDRYSGDTLGGAAISMKKGDRLQRLGLSTSDGRYEVKGVPLNGSLVITASGYLSTTAMLTATLPASFTLGLDPFLAKGIYIPFGLLSLPDEVLSILGIVDRTELNTIVVDVKSDRGLLAYPSKTEVALKGKAAVADWMDLKELLRLCKEKNIYAIARLVVFKDPVLTAVKPEAAIKYATGRTYIDLEGLSWGDPYRQEVRDYNIAIAQEVAALGFNEIQFDYLRFPSDGAISGLKYEITSTAETRSGAIAEFCAQAYKSLKPMGVMVSADLFGLTAWITSTEDMGIGQRLKDVAPYVDYLSPMLYPSTFASGSAGFSNPQLHPYEIINESCKRAAAQTKTKLRPWLQAYTIWGVEYGVNEMLLQKKAAIDNKTSGWLYWNAGGVYKEGVFEPAKR